MPAPYSPSSIHAVLDQYRTIAPDERTKGRYFEQLIQRYLQDDPVQSAFWEKVWLWNEWPDRNGKTDTGIDLVARDLRTGELTAIQCKFFDPDHTVQKSDIDSFFTASGKSGFGRRVIVSTTDKWSRNALDAITDQQIPTTRLGIDELDQTGMDWSQYRLTDPDTMILAEPKELRPHQTEAVGRALDHFDEHERGRLIMACGTGKTFTSLRLAERLVGNGGFVLFLVPSIALLAQTLREWTGQRNDPMRAFAVCSDVAVGRNSEDYRLTDLSIPATTDAARLVAEINAKSHEVGLTVVFSTYQSLQVLKEAQDRGLREFDLVICDEAHRTTGVIGEKESNFVKIHDAGYIRAAKRLYMTATPRIFGDAARKKADEATVELASMDDESRYGTEFHRLGFGEAVTRDLLTDYKVLVLAVKEDAVSTTFQQQWAKDSELSINDAAKIIGIYKALAKQGVEGLADDDAAPMRRAVAFASTIAASQRVSDLLNESRAGAGLFLASEDPLQVEAEHVDGTMNAMTRAQRLDWLTAEVPGNATRILTNARCLSEGVDVPSLDAVIFLNARGSQVDVVQSVGRVMRKMKDKHYGYIILPVVVPSGQEPEDALDDNERFRVVWEVLRALRAHDERFEAKIEALALNRSRTDEQIQVIGVDAGPIRDYEEEGADVPGGSDGTQQVALDFAPLGPEWAEAIYARILKKVGERAYWENWASGVAEVAADQTLRIRQLVTTSTDARASFDDFVQGLRDNLNPTITEDDAIEMLSQHLITFPVLEALFEGFDFLGSNPVARVMQRMLDALEGEKVASETIRLERFYDSVRARVRQITDPQGKQDFLKLLYQRFFSVAMRKASERFGIVYTPTEIVDFILTSADEVMRREFGLGLGDRDVNVLDPFTGTGTFIQRLVARKDLISDAQLPYKYRNELHANEISLLAYYVAAVNIEEAYHARMGGNYVPFDGIALTDTFQSTELDDKPDELQIFADNNAVVQLQTETAMRVILGNPPYAKGQGSGNDENQNLSYPTLDARIRDTYAARSTATNKNNLYDAYIRSIRWASDRIGDEGVVAFVTNGGFLEGNTADGVRTTLVDEFSTLYVYNLRGNQRTAGEQSRREGGKIFDSGSRATIAISVLVKKPGGEGAGRLFYRDIGDYLSRKDKLKILAHQSHGISDVDWTELAPNEHGDWIGERSDDFASFMLLASKDRELQNQPRFLETYSAGVKTNRDAWLYNFSRAKLSGNVGGMVAFMNTQVEAARVARTNGQPWDRDNDPTKASWNRADETRLRRGIALIHDELDMIEGHYRPFNRQQFHNDASLVDMVYQLPRLFPDPEHTNWGIYYVGVGSVVPFSVLMLDRQPDLHVTGAGSGGQFFPRFRYSKGVTGVNHLDGLDQEAGWTRHDNVTDAIQAQFRARFGSEVTKDDVFAYLYGILHSPDYRERFAADLKKTLPRIPLVPAEHYTMFRDAGYELTGLHRDYEQVQQWADLAVHEPEDADLLVKKMRYGGTRGADKTTIVYNGDITISGIPLEAQEYKLGSRSALDWILERYQVKTDKPSGIVNDPNDWGLEHGNPRYILELIGSIVTVSVETVRIVNSLPALRAIGSGGAESTPGEQ